jgi:hypothetical protein
VRRLIRHTLNALTALSLFLALASAVLWVRSYSKTDYAYAAAPGPRFAVVASNSGGVELIVAGGWPWQNWTAGVARDGVRIGTTGPGSPIWFVMKPGIAIVKRKGEVATLGIGPNVPVPDGELLLVSARIEWAWPIGLFSILPVAASLWWLLRQRRRASRGFPVEARRAGCAGYSTPSEQ